MAAARKVKGRGFRQEAEEEDVEDRYQGQAGNFESFDDVHAGVQKSVEGFVIFITGLHEEATEDDLHSHFGAHGQIRQLHLNLDRRTGFVKGYALIEFKTFDEAAQAINQSNGATILDQAVSVNWAFKPKPAGASHRAGGMGSRRGGVARRAQNRRSRSPRR